MFASLPMYLRAETKDALDHIWDAIHDEMGIEGLDAPAALDQTQEGVHAWLRTDMVLSQACGMPFRKELADKVTLVGTIDHGVDGCPAGYYRSVIIQRRGAGSGPRLRAVANSMMSQSGYAALLEFDPTYTSPEISGAHLNSARLVAEGQADIAAIDAVTWRLIETHEAFAVDLEVIHETTPTPGLPLITRVHGHKKDRLFNAIERALKAARRSKLQQLGIKGLVSIPVEEYLRIKP